MFQHVAFSCKEILISSPGDLEHIHRAMFWTILFFFLSLVFFFLLSPFSFLFLPVSLLFSCWFVKDDEIEDHAQFVVNPPCELPTGIPGMAKPIDKKDSAASRGSLAAYLLKPRNVT
jgi:hypothetical protein